jgi:hypothetical protein
MLRLYKVGLAALLFALLTDVAAAQSANQSPGRDSLLNGTLIGAGAGVASAAALDAVFCDNGFGGCDTPWRAYLTLGAIGGAAGAGIDFLIGRHADARKTRLRLAPILGPGRTGLRASLVLPRPESLPPLMKAREGASPQRRDSVWNGALIGAGIGGVGGAVWGRQMCGSNDSECFAIAGPVGILGGAGIGAAVGAIADALH